MFDSFIIFLGVCLGFVLLNWQQALPIIIIVGFLQDPIRKLVPGEPVILTTTAISLLFLVTGIIFLTSKKPDILEPFAGNKVLKITILLLVALVLIQCFLGYLKYGSLVMVAVGAVSYLGIFLALWTTWLFIKNTQSIYRLLSTYIACSICVSLGVYLSFWGWQSKILQQVGEGIFISSDYGNLIAHTGFMRSPEIAAWHIATGVCVLILLLLTYKKYTLLYFLSPVYLVMIGSGLLTGRRKAIAEIVVFAIVYFFLNFQLRQKKLGASIVTVLGLGIFIALVLFIISPDNLNLGQNINPYLERGSTVFGDSGERFQKLGFESIGWAIRRFGYFGIGAGTAGLGLAHFGGVVEGAGGAGEGGLGKIVVELGLPGLILITVLVYQVVQVIWRNIMLVAYYSPKLFSLSIGLLSLLIANIPMFISSSLLFGDPFILVICGSLVGILLAIPKLLHENVVSFTIEE